MTASDMPNAIRSPFTFHMLAQSGWYEFNMQWAGNLNWGRKGGCTYINDKCPTGYEFCSNPG